MRLHVKSFLSHIKDLSCVPQLFDQVDLTVDNEAVQIKYSHCDMALTAQKRLVYANSCFDVGFAILPITEACFLLRLSRCGKLHVIKEKGQQGAWGEDCTQEEKIKLKLKKSLKIQFNPVCLLICSECKRKVFYRQINIYIYCKKTCKPLMDSHS